jgi:hypothetical protein
VHVVTFSSWLLLWILTHGCARRNSSICLFEALLREQSRIRFICLPLFAKCKCIQKHPPVPLGHRKPGIPFVSCTHRHAHFIGSNSREPMHPSQTSIARGRFIFFIKPHMFDVYIRRHVLCRPVIPNCQFGTTSSHGLTRATAAPNERTEMQYGVASSLSIVVETMIFTIFVRMRCCMCPS